MKLKYCSLSYSYIDVPVAYSCSYREEETTVSKGNEIYFNEKSKFPLFILVIYHMK